MSHNSLLFILGEQGLPSWLIQGINQHLGELKSHAYLIQISNLATRPLSAELAILSNAVQPFELCQISLSDPRHEFPSELSLYLSQYCEIIPSTSPSSTRKLTQITTHCWQLFHQDITQPLSRFKTFTQKISQQTLLDKDFALQHIAKIADAESSSEILIALTKRENISSTAFHNGIALPHISSAHISQPQLVLLTLTTPIDWQSPFDDVSHIIALLLPETSSRDQLMSVRYLTKRLLQPDFVHFLKQWQSSEPLLAILSCWMSKELTIKNKITSPLML